MNIDLLLEVKEKILQQPYNFGMNAWDGRNSLDEECETAHCIGGWGVFLMRQKAVNFRDFQLSSLRELFQIDEEQDERLFHTDSWPHQFENAYEDAQQKRDLRLCAKVAAKRIDHFIATEGRE